MHKRLDCSLPLGLERSRMNWADFVLGGILLIGAFKGFKSGFIAELTGIIALTLAIWAGFIYNGFWDGTIARLTHLGAGSAHVLGLIAFGGEVYLIVSVVGMLLARIAGLPLIKIGNALLGGCVGLVKAAAFVWAVLYIALFFPLPSDVRGDLHHSTIVSLLTQPNGNLDEKIQNSLPDFTKFFTMPFFSRHRV
jgi:uncharacterized membrane protein required for colicin V production